MRKEIKSERCHEAESSMILYRYSDIQLSHRSKFQISISGAHASCRPKRQTSPTMISYYDHWFRSCSSRYHPIVVSHPYRSCPKRCKERYLQSNPHRSRPRCQTPLQIPAPNQLIARLWEVPIIQLACSDLGSARREDVAGEILYRLTSSQVVATVC
jgi:hypothetical protein